MMEKGRETKDATKSKTQETAQPARDKASDMAQSAKDRTHEGKEQTGSFMSDKTEAAKEKASHARSECK